MTHIETIEPTTGICGGRVSSPKFRASLQHAEEFKGLEESTDRFYALKLVKKAGKSFGFTSELIEMLEYYLIRTNEVDWREGNRPICYQAVITTAQDLEITERQVRNREKALNNLGALTWEDSGNFKRFGVRDRETGEIMYAFGVDLSPLSSLIPILEERIEEQKALKALWNERKRQISAYRARIRTLLAEAVHYDEMHDIVIAVRQAYEEIAYSIRSYHTLERLGELLEEHKLLYEGLFDVLDTVINAVEEITITENTSARDETDCRHIHSTTSPISNKLDTSRANAQSFQESVVESSEPKEAKTCDQGKIEGEKEKTPQTSYNLEHVTWKMMLGACSDRFKDYIPLHDKPLSWDDLIEAAHALLPVLKINKTVWWDACGTLGRSGAAICVMIIDQKSQDPDDPVRNPGGYMRQMVARAKTGELNLQGSVFGLLKRMEEMHDA